MKKYLARAAVFVMLSLFVSSICLVSMPDTEPWWSALAAGFGTVGVFAVFIGTIRWGMEKWNA